MASDDLVLTALGRPFSLGMLYDACRDELQTGITLWDKQTLEAHKSVKCEHTCAFEVTTSDSIESKSKLLDVETSLKASFLSGLIEVEGSAKYLTDQKKFKNQSRVTCHYKVTTNFQHLSMTDEKKKNKLMQCAVGVNIGFATHVVTGIRYGANAFFVFDSEKLDSSSVQDVQGSMKALIQKIPETEIDVSGKVELTNEEKDLTNKISCKFIGDFILPNNPTTFQEAVQIYKDLSKLLGQKYENSIPMKVWLTPLEMFGVPAIELKHSISIEVVRKAGNALEDIVQAVMRCNDSLEDEVVEKVPSIVRKLTNYQNLCIDYKSHLQQTMKKEFPLIRAGRKDEVCVKKLLGQRENSPFSYKNLNNWINDREKEINVIRSCVDIMKGTKAKMVTNQSELDSEILDQALCFIFTCVESNDPYLDQMSKYLETNEYSDEIVTLLEKDQWYNSKKVLIQMKEKARDFSNLAQQFKDSSGVVFLVAALLNQNYQGATIYYYKDGVLDTEDFKTAVIDVKYVTDRRALIQYATDLNMDPNTCNSYLTLSEDRQKATCGAWQYYSDGLERFDKQTQVLSTEGLNGIHYWEVEWSEGYWNYVGVGVTYKGIERKGNGNDSFLGGNTISWLFVVSGWFLYAWHKNQEKYISSSSDIRRVGVFLDWPGGTLSLYSIVSNTVSHIYTFYTKFNEPVYVGFYAWYRSNYVCLCGVEEE